MILSVILMFLDHHYNRLPEARRYLSNIAYPLQWSVDAPFRLTNFAYHYLSSHQSLLAENEALSQKLFIQSAEMQRLLAVEAENAQLRSLLQASKKVHNSLKVVEVLQVDSDPFNHRLILNKGEQDGVTIGQPIIDAYGLVGAVVEVFSMSSRVILVTDASHAVPIENVRSGVRGILVGTGAFDSLKLQYVPKTADIQVGDVLVTSGLGGRFPAGYPVGEIIEISQDAGESFAKVLVKPSANLDHGRQLLLIEPNSNPNSNSKSDNEASKIERHKTEENNNKTSNTETSNTDINKTEASNTDL